MPLTLWIKWCTCVFYVHWSLLDQGSKTKDIFQLLKSHIITENFRLRFVHKKINQTIANCIWIEVKKNEQTLFQKIKWFVLPPPLFVVRLGISKQLWCLMCVVGMSVQGMTSVTDKRLTRWASPAAMLNTLIRGQCRHRMVRRGCWRVTDVYGRGRSGSVMAEPASL